MFDRLAPDVEGWIREVAKGYEVERMNREGVVVKLTEGRDPGKAAELSLRMAEFHIPKLGRTEVTGEDGGPVAVSSIERVIIDPAKGT
jgi:hypothetical protein